MFSPVLALLMSTALVGADIQLQGGTQLAYRGSVYKKSEPADAQKTFDLLLVVEAGDAGRKVRWLLDERGQGGWHWLERFGETPLDGLWQWAETDAPALLFDRDQEGTSVVPLPPLFLAAQADLAADARWSAGRWEFHVLKQTTLEERPVWQIAVRNGFGPKRTVWLDRTSPVAVGLNERVFMGMGDEYELQIRLVGSEQLPAAEFEKLSADLDALLDLRARLNRPARSEAAEWNAAQLAVLADRLPELKQKINAGPLASLVRAIERDSQLQSDRVSSVAELSAQRIGQTAPKFTAPALDAEGPAGQGLTDAALGGQVTVLHFWEYRDTPLKEPYGQVGYLDFLHNRYKDRGVRVYGVAVDGRLANAQNRAAALRSVRKFRAFMNVGFPQLLDAGDMLEQFGDPRIVGVQLPLFVVIGPDRKIIHYHAGFYDVDRDQGLKELDSVVSGAAAGTR